jgi:hypothetical protein
MSKGVKFISVIIPSWLALGFYRGTKSYGRDYKKKCIEYEERKNNKYYTVLTQKPQYLYSSCVWFGLFGFLLYVNPVTALVVIPKELYRLEVNMRGLHEEKEKDEYYEIF